ncbi:MAG TPA: hypothetical protein VN253_04425 [Kofleriaceae bacterium]|nr:hypothetical protein [Kofleriaceae bacterium]
MSYVKTWSGDWHGRILERVHQRGFENATQYANARIGVSLLVLAKELGPDDIAAVQLETILVEEAIRTDTIPRVLRDLFVRELRERLPQGWKYPLDEESRVNVVGAIVDWETQLKNHLDDASRFAAGQAFLNAELPAGWLPEGPDDPVIIAFVDRCLGRVPV